MVVDTAQNVYKGNAAMMTYYSALDRGREPATPQEAAGSADRPGYGCHYAVPANVNLCLPSGSGLDWGNRDYDVNLLVADKAFDAQGQLFFNVFNTDGFLGDVMTVNFLYKPYLDVRARKYRFRILNGSVSRYVKIALVDQTGAQVPFHLVANDGNLVAHAIRFPNVQSPEGVCDGRNRGRYHEEAGIQIDLVVRERVAENYLIAIHLKLTVAAESGASSIRIGKDAFRHAGEKFHDPLVDAGRLKRASAPFDFFDIQFAILNSRQPGGRLKLPET